MNTKYNDAVNVCTSLMNMKKKYYLSFTCDMYNDDLELFRIKLTQTVRSVDGKESIHKIIINYSGSNEEYQVWSDQINPYKNPKDPYPEYNDVSFDNHKKMCTYIYHLLELYNESIN